MYRMLLIYIATWLCLMYAASSATENSYKSATDRMKELFHGDNYDKRLRPFYKGPPLKITVGMSVVHLGKLREVDMDFSVDVFFRQYWQDPRLKHTLEEPIVLTGSHRNVVWLPDTFFLNIKTANYHNVPADNSRVTIEQDGQITWSSRITMTANCQMDLRDYPLDEQSCNLTLLSYAYPIQQVDYFWKARDKQGIVILADEMNEFTLTNIKTRKGMVQYGTRESSSQYTHLMAVFTFERRLGYAFIQMYVPTVLIVALSWLSFWVSKDAVPARVALVVTTVLTIVTLMGSFRSSVPKVSYVKALDVFFIISLFFVFGAVLEYIIVRLYSENKLAKQEKQEEAIDIELMPLKLNDNGAVSEDQRPRGNKPLSQENFEQTKEDNADALRKTKRLLKVAFGKSNASVIDRVSRILFPVAYVAFNIFYWCYYSVLTFNNV